MPNFFKQFNKSIHTYLPAEDIKLEIGFGTALLTYKDVIHLILSEPDDGNLMVSFAVTIPEGDEELVPTYQIVGILSSVLVCISAELDVTLSFGEDELLTVDKAELDS
jgi:hypothetical protein